MVVVIVVTGILMAVVSSFISMPIQAYINTTRRAELVDAAEMALRRLERDIRRAVPNSVRITNNGNVQALELAHTVTGFRYRANVPGDILSFNIGGDSSFDVLEQIDSGLLGTFNYRLSVNNRGETNANLYTNTDVITPASTNITLSNIGNMGRVTLSAPFLFTSQSPMQRVYVIDTPVTYRCNPDSSGVDPKSIRRFWGYSIQNAQPIDPTSAPLSTADNALLVQRISNCTFEYIVSDPSQRNAIVNIGLTITSGTENIRLFHQVVIGNAP